MRLEETGLRITDDAVLAHNASGEIISEYVRHKTPLELWRRNGLRETEYQAGQRYGALWRDTCRPRSPAHSDTTRIIVDGGGAGELAEICAGRLGDSVAFREAQAAIGNEETITALNRLCGMEDWPLGDKRRFKRVCMRGLKRLVKHWRKR